MIAMDLESSTGSTDLPSALQEVIADLHEMRDEEASVGPSIENYFALRQRILDIDDYAPRHPPPRRSLTLAGWMLGVSPADFGPTQKGEYRSYSSIAVLVILSSILSGVCGAITMSVSTGASVRFCSVVGGLYGLFNLFLQRALLVVKPTSTHESYAMKLWRQGPRVAMTLVLYLLMSSTMADAFTISAFDTEVRAQLRVRDAEAIEETIGKEIATRRDQMALTSEILDEARAESRALAEELDQLLRLILDEKQGANGSVPGSGPRVKALEVERETKRRQLEALEKEREVAKMTLVDAQVRVEDIRRETLARFEASNGLLDKLSVLDQLPSKIRAGIQALFALLMLAPFIARLALGPTTFQRALSDDADFQHAISTQRRLTLVSSNDRSDS
jgi:hypothetical protein